MSTEPKPCPKCGGKIALASGYLSALSIDQEPFVADVVEPPGEEDIACAMELSAHVCVGCGHVTDCTLETEDHSDRVLRDAAPDLLAACEDNGMDAMLGIINDPSTFTYKLRDLADDIETLRRNTGWGQWLRAKADQIEAAIAKAKPKEAACPKDS